MKLKSLSAALVAAGVLMNSAFALSPTDTINLHLYIAGASAQDKALQTMATKLCDTGGSNSLDVYTDAGVSKPEGSSYSAIACTMTAAKVPGLSGNLNVMIHKRSAGGSAWGVGPVASGDSIAQMAITTANCGSAPVGNTTINGVSTRVWNCGNTNTVSAPADAGISDVEPAMFAKASNLIPVGAAYGTVSGDPGTFPVPDSELEGLTVIGMSSVTFGVPVTKALRDALQLAQGKTVGSDALADMPSLSKEQIASLFTGSVGSWNNFKMLDTATSTWVGLNQLTGVVAPATARVNICRRVPGSGTQAQFNALFLNDGCTDGALTVRADNTPNSAITGGTGVALQPLGSGVVVHENNGSGDLDSCLNNLQDANIWGIGLQSLEKGSDKYRFIAIDGVAPTLQNVATNKYWDWAANSIQWRTADISGDKLTILSKIATEISNPTDLAALNASFNPRITGAGVGLLALNTNGSPKYTAGIPFSTTNPVMTVTRNGVAGTSAPNTCRAAVVLQNSASQL